MAGGRVRIAPLRTTPMGNLIGPLKEYDLRKNIIDAYEMNCSSILNPRSGGVTALLVVVKHRIHND